MFKNILLIFLVSTCLIYNGCQAGGPMTNQCEILNDLNEKIFEFIATSVAELLGETVAKIQNYVAVNFNKPFGEISQGVQNIIETNFDYRYLIRNSSKREVFFKLITSRIPGIDDEDIINYLLGGVPKSPLLECLDLFSLKALYENSLNDLQSFKNSIILP
ncbi:hypothetical protein PVAND_017428 [Polypedilum vanderplanki]|uniref:Secreted protein n=1 Tax=Polypedilum vanderplanki TaxID=319348 RepID=A0A9J6BI87_POLVA|nr:hypothetical protein PVAND_017428 [Polypedilum vanderplanki]